jgi:hypothetical protein
MADAKRHSMMEQFNQATWFLMLTVRVISRENCRSERPLSSMNGSFQKLFMRKFTRERIPPAKRAILKVLS